MGNKVDCLAVLALLLPQFRNIRNIGNDALLVAVWQRKRCKMNQEIFVANPEVYGAAL